MLQGYSFLAGWLFGLKPQTLAVSLHYPNCVCVCVRVTDRYSERDRERDSDRESVRR